MAINSTSSSSLYYFFHCSNSAQGTIILIVFIMTHVLLLIPLSLLVLYLGLQRWRQQRLFATTSHSDIFTYHSVFMELPFVLGAAFYFSGLNFDLKELTAVGYYVTSNYFIGQISFHVLTCVERYLAVVHPVLYLRLKQSGGVRIRNISIGCVWLLYCGWIGVEALYFPNFPYNPIFCLLTSSLAVVSFCSLSVLCVLIRPGPGEVGGKKEPTDQSKQRAFHTITAITGVLWLFFLGCLLSIALEQSNVLGYTDGCLLLMGAMWVSVPSSLILPVLFLHRAGKNALLLLQTR